jgi:hypothetical protein
MDPYNMMEPAMKQKVLMTKMKYVAPREYRCQKVWYKYVCTRITKRIKGMDILGKLNGMLAEGDGKLSNKRVITLLSTLMLVVAFVANLFFNYKIDDNILNAIMFVIIGGMGITGMEKFAPKITDQIKK